MADQKISELTALTGANVADDDAIAIVDTSATETKKIVFSELKNALDTATGFVRITGDTMTGALTINSNLSVDGGTIKLDGNYPVGAQNVALGDTALDALTSGTNNTAVGSGSLETNSSGSYNTSMGRAALTSNTTGSYNTAVGRQALNSNTTANNNTAVGYQAGYANTTGGENVFLGYQAGKAVTTGAYHTIIGGFAGQVLTTGTNNTLIGDHAGDDLTTGSYNCFVGARTSGSTYPGGKITTGSKNTILGSYNGNQGGLDIRTSSNNIVLSDGDGNPRLYLGPDGDLYIGCTSVPSATVSGFSVQDNAGKCYVHQATNTTGNNIMTAYINPNGIVGGVYVNGSSTSYNTSSDHRLKENVVDLTGATTRLKQLEPKRFNFIADADTTVDGFLAHEVQAIVPEAIHGTKDEVDADGNPVYQGIDQSKLVPLLVATIKELEARITALENA